MSKAGLNAQLALKESTKSQVESEIFIKLADISEKSTVLGFIAGVYCWDLLALPTPTNSRLNEVIDFSV